MSSKIIWVFRMLIPITLWFWATATQKVQDLLEAVNRHAALACMRINASKTKMMSELVSDEKRQAGLIKVEL